MMNIKRIVLLFLTFFVLALMSVLLFFIFVDRTNGSIKSFGQTRRYLLYVPESYQPGKPVPLVISLHGFASWPAHQQQVTRFNTLADRDGFLVVYPRGRGFPLRWQTGVYGSVDPLVDVVFLNDLMDKILAEYSIDPARIYVNGFSSGGGMAHYLACTTADRIAAIGTVSGAFALAPEYCQPSRPVPVIAFHGTDDRIVPYQGGEVSPPGYTLPAVIDWVANWAVRNDCTDTPLDLDPVWGGSTVKVIGCVGEAEVRLYSIDGGGHSWPGGQPMPEFIVGHTTDKIDASELMIEFFHAYSLQVD